MGDDPVLNWKLTDGILEGYPHNYYKELLTLGEKWKVVAAKFDGYPYIYNRELRTIASSKAVWSISGDILDGYPHIHYRELIPPYHLPQFVSMALNRTDGFIGVGGDLDITVAALKYIALEDVLVVEVYNSSDTRLYFAEVPINQEGKIDSFSCTVPETLMQSLAVGNYSVKVTVKRNADEIGTSVSGGYTVNALPTMTIKSVTPAALQKPVTDSNKELSVLYEISGEKIKRVENTFSIAGFYADEAISDNEMLTITSSTLSSRIDTLNFIFTVTDVNFILKSFKFQFGNYTASTRLQISVDGKVYVDATLAFPNWHGYVFPDGLRLAQGSHTIKFYCPPSYFYAYKESSKPQAAGLTITSSTVYAMEMEYTVSTSGIAGERTAAVTVDDSITPGEYTLTIESTAILDGYGEYNFGQTSGNLLTVLESQIRNPSIASVMVSASGRYVGCETDVIVTASGLADVLEGDAVTIILNNSGSVLYSHTDTLSLDAASYLYTVTATAFAGLGVGSYTIAVKITRGEFAEEKSATYSVITAPTLAFVTIAPDTVQLPITAPLSLSSGWRVTGSGVDSVQGSITLAGTAYSTSVNKADTDFTAVITNITTLTAGIYSLTADLTVTSDDYGSVQLAVSHDDLFSVLAPILEPEIGSVTLDVSGRYAGSETDVTIIASGLANILAGDGAVVQLYQGASVFYEHTESLSAGASAFQHTISLSAFSGLDYGDYAVNVSITRSASIRCEKETTYQVVAPPTVWLTSVTPDSIQLPMVSPVSINITLKLSGDGLSGEGASTVAGSVELDGSDYSQSVNQSVTKVTRQVTVTLSGVHFFSARGYLVTANLTVTNTEYGTASVTAAFDNALRVLAAERPKNHRSGNVYIYKGFELVHIFKTYISFKWVRRFNKPGEFILQLENTPANVRLIRNGNIITKDNDDEAGFIEDITIGDKIEVKGAFISKMLSYRVVNFTSETPVNLQTTAEQLLRWNFINSGAGRAVPGFRIAEYSITPQNVLTRIENGSMLQWLEKLDAGFKVAFLPAESAYGFSMYDGKPSDAVFCESFKNITDQQYYKQSANAKNVCLIEVEEGETVTVGTAQGLERREAYISAGKYDPNELGAQFLKQNEPVESLDVKIVNPDSPFEYKKDYDVGSVVTITSESYGVEITKNILEVTEFFDRTGFHLYVVFGSVPRDLLTELKDKEKRIEELEKEIEQPVEPELSEEVVENLKDLIVPEIVDEVFEELEFPPLPEYLNEETLNDTIETIVDGKLDGFVPGGGGGSGDGIHIIIDHLPVQSEIDTYPVNAEVLVYDSANPYVPAY